MEANNKINSKVLFKLFKFINFFIIYRLVFFKNTYDNNLT